MTVKRLALTLFLSAVMLIVASSASMAAEEQAVGGSGFALLGVDIGATAGFASYERKIAPNLTIGGQLGFLNYKYDDGTYIEDGKGNGIEAVLRYYPKEAFKGLFLGGAAGLWQTKWDWTDDVGKTYQTKGSGKTTALGVNFNVGYNIPLGASHLLLAPQGKIGYYIGLSESSTGPKTQSSTLGLYAVGGVSLSYLF